MNFSRKGGKGFTFIITVIYWFRTWCLVSNSPSPNHLHLDFFFSLLMIHVFVPFTEVISVHYLINANFRPFYLSTVETNTRSSYFDASTTNGSIPYYNYDCKVADCSAPFHESFNVLYPCCFVQTIYKQKYLRMFCQWCQIWNVLPPSFRFVLSFVFQQALYELKLIEWWTFRYRCPWTRYYFCIQFFSNLSNWTKLFSIWGSFHYSYKCWWNPYIKKNSMIIPG